MNNEIYIDGEKFEYVDSISYKGKKYIAYMDKGNVYINEYIVNNGNIEFKDITPEELQKVKEVMEL